MAYPSYIIQNTSFTKNGLGTLKFHFESGEIHCSKETYQFTVEHSLTANRYFEIRDTKENDLLMPWSIFCHLENLGDQIIHCGNLVQNITEKEPQVLSQLKNKTLYIDVMQYGLNVYFYFEIRVNDDNRPVCVLAYKSKQNNKTLSLSFPLEKFIPFLKENLPCTTMYIGYSKGLFIEQEFPSFPKKENNILLKPKHVHQTSHVLFQCTCPPSGYDKFATNNKLIKYKA